MGKYRKLIVYLIFIISVIYGVYFHFLSDSKTKPENQTENARTEKRVENYIEDQARAAILASAHNSFILPAGWGRNPFKLLTETASTIHSREPINKTGRMPRLTGISYYEGEPCFTIIDNRILRPGEEVSGWRVLSVKKDYVIIRRDNVEKKLLLGEIN